MYKKDVTVLYYSANVEDPIFEAGIRERLLANIGDLPLVSVSQTPLPGFGHNICVGRHYCCYSNEFRQIQIGLKAVTTPYVLTAEADCLYPPEYFQFKPGERGHTYRYGNVWVHYYLDPHKRSPKFYFKKFSDGAQAIDRDLWLDIITKGLAGRKKWTSPKDAPIQSFAIRTNPNFQWTSENPVITFKTRQGVSKYTQLDRSVPPQSTLPFWGSASDLRKALFLPQ